MTNQELQLKKQELLNRKLIFSIIINTAFTIFECFVGITIGSLALISDAAQNLTDTLSLAISLIARKISHKPANKQKTWGYGRATILAALINGIILFLVALFIFRRAYEHLLIPEHVEGGPVMILGFFGIIINGGLALMFLNHRDDISIRSAFLNMIFDALASAGALFAGIIILLTNKSIIDPIVSIVIGCMLIVSSFRILSDVVHILLEGVPATIALPLVAESISSIPQVIEVDSLRIWALSSFDIALVCQIKLNEKNLVRSVEIINNIKHMLSNKFNIHNVCIEIKT